MSKPGALEGVNVLDLSESIGGAYCTKLLADLGATVALVEYPPAGHPLRHSGPLSSDGNSETGGMFLYYGANKRSIACDLDTSAGRERIIDLASEADIVVESSAPGHMSGMGVGYDELSALNPALVYTSVTHFGQTGPYRDWKSDEIVDFALSPRMDLDIMDARGAGFEEDGAGLHTVQGRMGLVFPVQVGPHCIRAHRPP